MRYVLVALLLLAAVPADCLAGPKFAVEAEWYTESYNAGGFAISRHVCATALNDTTVAGLDAVGDWISIPVTFPQTGLYVNVLRAAGSLGVEYAYALILIDEQSRSEQISTAHYTGAGLG
jgi:hypothetical protein